jgi:methionyl-tRNA synthetase
MIQRYNSDLANGLGNLASRTLSMIKQYRDGVIPGPADRDVSETITRYVEAFEKFDFSRGLEALWSLISWADGYIVEQAPWKLAKDRCGWPICVGDNCP